MVSNKFVMNGTNLVFLQYFVLIILKFMELKVQWVSFIFGTIGLTLNLFEAIFIEQIKICLTAQGDI